ncbi:MAG: DUF2520 domain-containing protein [Bacteroidales bacterium]|nr:DUF2520 domain-containing protein [Bacteroidales bacterium]
MKTSISIVGAGNVATHMAIALHQGGCTIRQILSRTYDHAQLLAMKTEASPITDWQRLEQDVDACLLCVDDDALYDQALDLRLPKSLVLHTSGSTPISVLNRISPRHGVLWSPQTFIRDIAMDYSRLPLCIEGNTPKVEEEIESLASTISPCIYHLNQEQRRKAHLAAVMVSNFVNAINATAQDYMTDAGLDFTMLRPLAEQTLHKWDYGNLWTQQTGPAIRHDEKTLTAHRRLLSDNPHLLQLYNLLTELIQAQ